MSAPSNASVCLASILQSLARAMKKKRNLDFFPRINSKSGAVESEKDDVEIELRCQEKDSRGKFGRILAEVWVGEDGHWTNVNKWMCDEGYAVPYVGQNKADVEALHMANREKLRVAGLVDP
jgi:hypothetical protein